MLIGIDASRATRARRTGTERYALEIICHLLALPEATQHHWRLYTDAPFTSEMIDNLTVAPNVKVEVSVLSGRRLWTHRALAREMIYAPPEVLFVPAHVIPFCWPASRLPPSVVTIHDLGYKYFPQTHSWSQRSYLHWSTCWSSHAAQRVIAVSKSTASDLMRFCGTPAVKINVIHEGGIPHSLVSPTTSLQSYGFERPYALYVGTIQPRKNLERILNAYAKLAKQNHLTWDLVLAGAPGWMSQPIYTLVKDLQLAKRVHFLGYVPDVELPALFKNARFLCFPSLFEGFGLPVLEAQQYGVPVMTANNSALPEIAGDAALLVDPTDIDAIADAMLRLSQDETLRQQLIAAGHENVKRFSWKEAAQKTLAVLEQAAQAKQR